MKRVSPARAPDAITCLSYRGWNPLSGIIHWAELPQIQQILPLCNVYFLLVWTWLIQSCFILHFHRGLNVFHYCHQNSVYAYSPSPYTHEPQIKLGVVPLSFLWLSIFFSCPSLSCPTSNWKKKKEKRKENQNTCPNPSLCHVSLEVQCKLLIWSQNWGSS